MITARAATSARTAQYLLGFATAAGYLLAAAAVAAAWSARKHNLIRAEDGLGYWLGVAGALLMLLLLVYPLRKRVRALARIGSVRFWFRTHMIFGVLGPLLVLLHSNFMLGSLNSRVALFCTLVVASSGIIGRYLYARIHHGLYGQRVTLASLQAEIAADSTRGQVGQGPVRLVEARLVDYERRVLSRAGRILPSIFDALTAPFLAWRFGSELRRAVRLEISAAPDHSEQERQRLRAAADAHLARRIATCRRLAQLRGCERLFSLWHVVHFPLFLVMVFAAIVHVIAVHAY